jgi:hypothetical protein
MSLPDYQARADLDARLSDRLAKRVPRDVVKAVEREQGAALVRNARVEGRAYVARTAMINTALLSVEEAQLAQIAPHAEGRLKAIADSYTIFAAGEVAK